MGKEDLFRYLCKMSGPIYLTPRKGVIMNDLIHYHAEALHEAVSNWPEGEALNPNDEKSQALAFEILQHAALLHRYTADDGVLNYLLDLPADERRNLMIAASQYLDTRSLADRLKELEESDFDENEQAMVEEALIARDALGAAVELGNRLTIDQRVREDKPDFELLRALGYARAQLEMLDEAFSVIRPATLVSMQVLEGLKAAIRTPIDSSWWWFEDGEAILQAEDDAFMARLFRK